MSLRSFPHSPLVHMAALLCLVPCCLDNCMMQVGMCVWRVWEGVCCQEKCMM